MKNASFQAARPVWARGLCREMNITLRFEADLPAAAGAVLRIAGSSAWQIFLGEAFLAAGPARAGHGYRRVDEIPLPSGGGKLSVLIAGYNVNSYYLVDEPAFLCAEIVADGRVLAATGVSGFSLFRSHKRLQKVQRYSGQRVFAEVYDLNRPEEAVEWEEAPAGQFIERETPYPDYDVMPNARILTRGAYTADEKPATPAPVYRPASKESKNYSEEELEFHPLVWLHENKCLPGTECDPAKTEITLGAHEWCIADLGCEKSGFISLEVEAPEGGALALSFDEILVGGDVKHTRLSPCSVIFWTLTPGSHRLLSFEPYSLRYLKLFTEKGITVRAASMILYEFPAAPILPPPALKDPVLAEIYDAAVASFRQNTLDIYMDCPSRERAGWLCDSFFTSRTEYALTGKSVVEHAFLENFLMPESFYAIPKGMLPMCYPGDHYSGRFIPNWAMWYVLEMEEYIFVRGGDRALADKAKEKIYALYEYFCGFENGDGLLEKLESWVFIEWSHCNNLVQDVNYPSNMLYAKMLDAMAHLYGDEALAAKAEKLRAVIREKSFDGTWFCDNAVRDASGKAVNSGECTETCQYYAFFTGTAAPETYPQLWETLVRDFGPDRRAKGLFPQIHPANAFIGNYLRLLLLWKEGYRNEVIENIRGYFAFMAERTGTLWEHDTERASCNHGFASHVIVWLREYAGE